MTKKLTFHTIPHKITDASKVIQISNFIGFIELIVNVGIIGTKNLSSSSSLLIGLITLVIMVALGIAVGLGKNWARWVLIILVSLGAIGSIFSIKARFLISPIMAIIFLLQGLIQIRASLMLFSKEAKLWYGRHKPHTSIDTIDDL